MLQSIYYLHNLEQAGHKRPASPKRIATWMINLDMNIQSDQISKFGHDPFLFVKYQRKKWDLKFDEVWSTSGCLMMFVDWIERECMR